MESYTTISASATDEFTEKRSRFIGQAFPVETEEEAMAIVASVKKQYHDAKHNVYAYVLKDGKMRYSEDGEPQGTAGVPILSVLQKSNIVDCILVVTRYFGGVLLGAGGLARAYTHAASLALDKAAKKEMCQHQILSLQCDYSAYGFLQPLLSEEGTILENAFSDTIFIRAAVLPEKVDALQKKLTEYSAGKLSFTLEEIKIFEKK